MEITLKPFSPIVSKFNKWVLSQSLSFENTLTNISRIKSSTLILTLRNKSTEMKTRVTYHPKQKSAR